MSYQNKEIVIPEWYPEEIKKVLNEILDLSIRLDGLVDSDLESMVPTILKHMLLNYMAGVMDCDGSYKSGCCVKNYDYEIMYPFKDMFGGKITLDKPAGYQSPSLKRQGLIYSKDYWRWTPRDYWGSYHMRSLMVLSLLPYQWNPTKIQDGIDNLEEWGWHPSQYRNLIPKHVEVEDDPTPDLRDMFDP